MANAGSVRVVIVDDHIIVRDSVRGFLKQYPNIKVVGEAGDGADALAEVERLKPALVLMDILMPKMDGIAATRFIKDTYPHIAVLGLAQHPAAYNVHAMVEAGASGVVRKDRMFEDLYGAIEKAVTSSNVQGSA